MKTPKRGDFVQRMKQAVDEIEMPDQGRLWRAPNGSYGRCLVRQRSHPTPAKLRLVKPHEPDHHDNERIVELTRVPSVVAAQGIVAELRGLGITAMTATDDVGGQRPSLTFAQGYRVLVFDNDLERAKQVLTDLGLD